MTSHQVLVFNALGQYVGDLTQEVTDFRYVKVANDIGFFEVTAPANEWPVEWRGRDYQYHFWRLPNGGAWQLDFVGLALDRFSDTVRGVTTKRVEGYGVNHLLARRVVAYKSGTAQSTKTDYLDDMCKAVVNDNLAGGASDARNIATVFNFSVAPDLSDAPSVTKSFAFENVLEVLKSLCDTSAGQASGAVDLYFNIACDAYTSNQRPRFEFRTYTGQLGIDRTNSGSNASAVVFSLENANIDNVHYQRCFSEEYNYVYAGGLGLKDDRNVQEAGDTTRIGESPIARTEMFVTATHLEDAETLEAVYEALNENVPTRKLSCTLLDTETTPYGVAWAWGDKVTVYYGEGAFHEMVGTVEVKVQNKKETISAQFGFGANLYNPVTSILKKLKKLEKELRRQANGEFAKYVGSGTAVPTTTELPREGMYYLFDNGIVRRVYYNLDGTIRLATLT